MAISIPVAIGVALSGPWLDYRDLDFFFVLFPFFNMEAIVLDLLINGALRIEHESQGATAFGHGVYWRDTVVLLGRLPKLWR
jgi:hypothetical protein